MKIIIDILGSDLGPAEIVEGVCDAFEKSSASFVLVGPKNIAQEIVNGRNIDKSRIEYVDTDEVISNEDDPARSIRRKKEASIVKGLNLLNEEGYDGIISAGSTGAMLAGGLFITKRIGNIDRAGLAAMVPTPKGTTILMDTGAVMDSKPEMLEQFAVMASVYAKRVLDKPEPKLVLLNVGVEDGKGDMRSKETFKLLKENANLNFIGNMEARDFLSGQADIIITDGFAGNVMLKATEGAVKTMFSELKKGIMSSFLTKLGGLMLKPSLKGVAAKYDYKEVGAAVLLGVKKPLFKAHGSSDRRAIRSAIYTAEKFIKNDVIKNIEEIYND